MRNYDQHFRCDQSKTAGVSTPCWTLLCCLINVEPTKV